MAEPPEHAPEPSPPGRARGGAMLAEMAPIVLWSIVALGLWNAVIELWDLGPGAEGKPILIIDAIARLGGVVLAAWVASRLIRVAAAVLDLYAAQAGAAPRLAAAAERLAAVLERPPLPTGTTPAPPPSSSGTVARKMALAEIRAAIQQDQWAQAELLIQAFADSYPGDPAATRSSDELATAKQAAVARLRDQLDAARAAIDPGRIFEIRDALGPLLAPEVLRELDRDLARWFMGQVQKRLRNGMLSADVVALATRVSDAFNGTPEGASLRAALPTLRRSVGLCARCGKPYTGLADACPACLATTSFPAYVPPPAPDSTADHDGPSQSWASQPTEENASEPE